MSDEEFSLGEKEEVISSTETGLSDSDVKDDNRISIDDFYDLMVKDWREGRRASYDVYLQQGNIAGVTIYQIMGMEPFAELSDDDIKRIDSWKNAWAKEAEKFQKTDLSKKEDLVDAIGTLCAYFLNKKRNEEFREVIKNATWAQLSALIADKCSDKIVELYEFASILNAAAEYGLLSDELRAQTIETIKEQIKDSESSLQNIDEAFLEYFKKYTSQNSKNIIDNETNNKNLMEKYKELKLFDNQINNIEKEISDAQLGKDYKGFLKKLNISLRPAEDVFIEEYFNEFKNSHDLSQPLSAQDYANLSIMAKVSYGFSDEQWKRFESENGILVDKGVSQEQFDTILNEERESQQSEIQNLKLEIERLKRENELNKQPAVKVSSVVPSRPRPVVTRPKVSEKKRSVALLLCLFLGGLGAHKFYTGRIKAGIFTCLACCIYIGWLFVLIDFIKILGGTFKDSKELPLKNW